jgi:hypothetical protein
LSLKTDLRRLAEQVAAAGAGGDRCPACPRWLTLLTYRDDEAPPEVPCCEACGREVEALVLHEVTVPGRGEAQAFFLSHPDHPLARGGAAGNPQPPGEPSAPASPPPPPPPQPDPPARVAAGPGAPEPGAPPAAPREGTAFWQALALDMDGRW